MIHSSTLRAMLCCALLTSSALSQTIDTARVRTVYDAVAARRNEIERSNGHFAEVNGIRMHYLEWGAPNGVPLVWAHGPSGTGYEVRNVAPQLVQAGYRVIAVDYRGHGQTRVANYEFSIQDVADDLVALLDHLKIRAAVFGGASKGAFIASAVYDQYPDRVLGLLLANGGTWSDQWIFDHTDPAVVRDRITWEELPPDISGPSEFAVFMQMVGRDVSSNANPAIEPLFDLLVRINPAGNNRWAFLPGFSQMMGTIPSYTAGVTRPTTLPLFQWSEHAMIPLVVYRHLNVPMMILDPQQPNEVFLVTDQNERLARLHPTLVTHRVYPQTNRDVLRAKPDWFVRDALELLGRVRERASR
jgi:pimeloyl-ACP methyl ester carboxylesterase